MIALCVDIPARHSSVPCGLKWKKKSKKLFDNEIELHVHQSSNKIHCLYMHKHTHTHLYQQKNFLVHALIRIVLDQNKMS